MNRVVRCCLSLALIVLGVYAAFLVFFSCTFEPMMVTEAYLLTPNEAWLQRGTTLKAWRPHEEFPICDYQFCREGTLFLPFYEITFIHGVDNPNDLAHMHLETTEIKARRERMAAGIVAAALVDIVIAGIIWRLWRRQRENGLGVVDWQR